MPLVSGIIPFEEAMGKSQGNKSLLLGNGFSAKYFNYKNLLESIDNIIDSNIRDMFEEFKTLDFEYIINVLETSARASSCYKEDILAEKFNVGAKDLRVALISAIRAVHPSNKNDIIDNIKFASAFIGNYKKVYTLNYDLLLYWIAMENRGIFTDGFGSGAKHGGFIGPFKNEAYCSMHYVHGGLHLFERMDGDIEKKVARGG